MEDNPLIDSSVNLSRRLITYVETSFFLTGALPTFKDLSDHLGISVQEAKDAFKSSHSALQARGIPENLLNPPSPVKTGAAPENDFDPLFVLACNLITNSVDKRSTAAKLKSIGASTAQWKGWLRIQKNREYFEFLLNESFRDVEHAAKLSLSRNVESGDLQSIKYFHEYTGRYRPNQELTLNLGIILGRLMEILAARLEPAVLAEIAEEFDQVLEVKELSA